MAAIALPKPGYVYAMANRSLPGWTKVGFTTRPPHLRAHELSRTEWPTPFDVTCARFSWDAPRLERAVHAALTRMATRLRELFQMDPAHVANVLQTTIESKQPLRVVSQEAFDPDAAWAWRHTDADWEHSRDGLEEQWAWGDEEIASSNADLRRQGWARHYALSGQGWPEGSRRLADALAQPGTLEAAQRAGWVYAAAEAQGLQGGRLRGAWTLSWHDPQALAAFQDQAAAWVAHQDQGKRLPGWVEETLLEEQQGWSRSPHRRFDPRALRVERVVAPKGP